MDWRLFHGIYDVSLHHHWVGSFFNGVEKASIPVMVIATAALWLFARPGGDRKWKLAAVSGLGAAALALVVNLVIHAIHDRPRPYEAHAIRHPWASSTDASLPSDHASASLAIAFVVLAFDTVVGAVFLVAALLIAVGRVFIGAHYPGDIGVSLARRTRRVVRRRPPRAAGRRAGSSGSSNASPIPFCAGSTRSGR